MEDFVTRVLADSEEVLCPLLASSLSPDRVIAAPQERELKEKVEGEVPPGKAAGPKVTS